jgi:hypothetical protein
VIGRVPQVKRVVSNISETEIRPKAQRQVFLGGWTGVPVSDC